MQTMYSNLYIIWNLYKRHYQIMVSATKKHAIRPFNHPWRSPRRNSFKSRFSRAAKAAMALRRNDLCGPGETHGSRMIFRASHDEGKHLFTSRLGMIGFRNVIQIWFGRLLCRFLLVWWLWFVDWLTDCFIGCKIALLDRISSHLPKEHDINRYETRKKITRHVFKRHVVIKNQPVRHVHQKATALEQKITFRIPFGLHPTRSAGCRPNISVVGGSNLDSSPPSTRWIRWFHNRLKIAENCGGIPNPCHLNHNFIWQFNHALLKWSIYKCIYEIKKISEIWLKYKFNWSRIGTPSRLPSSAEEHLLIESRSLQWHHVCNKRAIAFWEISENVIHWFCPHTLGRYLGWNIWGIFQGYVGEILEW